MFTYLSSVLPDALPQRLENRVKGLDTIRSRRFSQRSDSEGTDGPHLLLLVHQAWRSAEPQRDRQNRH